MIWNHPSKHQTKIITMLEALLIQGETIMTAVDDLNAVVVTLGTAVNSAVVAIATEVAALQAALANSAGSLDPADAAAIEVAVGNIQTLANNLNTAVATTVTPVANTPVSN